MKKSSSIFSQAIRNKDFSKIFYLIILYEKLEILWNDASTGQFPENVYQNIRNRGGGGPVGDMGLGSVGVISGFI